MSAIDTSDMAVFSACFCCNTVLWTDFPAFVGCAGLSECLCIKEEFCLKQNTEPMPCVLGVAEGFICQIGAPCCSCGLKNPDILLKSKGQCCCFIGNAALPLDEDTPPMCAIYGLTLFPIQGCCLKLSEVKAAIPASTPAAAPAAAAPADSQA
jgi:hypothetical protein